MFSTSVKSDFQHNNFDVLRLIAASQVMVVHCADRLQYGEMWWTNALKLFPGVPIFFVISGFLVSASLDRSTSLYDYFTNRALRILPGLWGCIIVTFIVTTLSGFDVVSLSGIKWAVLQMVGAIYTPGILEGFGSGTYNGSLWTIPVELQFYIILPVVYLMSRAAPRTTLIGFFVLAVIVAIAYGIRFPFVTEDKEPAMGKLLRYTFAPHIYLFLFGVILQKFKAYSSPLFVGKAELWIVAYVAAALLLPTSVVLTVSLKIMLGAVAISFAYTGTRAFGELLNKQDISYGVYIYHGLMINVIIEFDLTQHVLAMPLVIALTLVAASFSWLCVEHPVLRLKKRKKRATTTLLANSTASDSTNLTSGKS